VGDQGSVTGRKEGSVTHRLTMRLLLTFRSLRFLSSPMAAGREMSLFWPGQQVQES
jgi:hypothetical protein